MTRHFPAVTIRNDVLYLRLDGRIEDPALRRIAGCIRGLTAFVECAAQRHGAGTVMASLIALAVNMALRHGDSDLIADALRRNADILELEGRLGAFATRELSPGDGT
jgi:hypothetical protein